MKKIEYKVLSSWLFKLIIAMTVFLLFLVAVAKAQERDDIYYLPIGKGITTARDMFVFHESDYILSCNKNAYADNEVVVVFYNDTPKDFSVYIFYVVKDGIVIKSRYCKIKEKE